MPKCLEHFISILSFAHPDLFLGGQTPWAKCTVESWQRQWRFLFHGRNCFHLGAGCVELFLWFFIRVLSNLMNLQTSTAGLVMCTRRLRQARGTSDNAAQDKQGQSPHILPRKLTASMLQMEDSALSYREKIPVVQHTQVSLCCQTSGPRMRIPTQGKKPSLLKQPSYKRIDSILHFFGPPRIPGRRRRSSARWSAPWPRTWRPDGW